MEPGKHAFIDGQVFEIRTVLQFSLILFVAFSSDREYPRLGQMIVDYENPLKKMMEEFVPHSKVCVDFLFFSFFCFLLFC